MNVTVISLASNGKQECHYNAFQCSHFVVKCKNIGMDIHKIVHSQ